MPCAHDVHELAALLRDWPQVEYNIEGNPFHNLLEFVRTLSEKGLPIHQCTFVPDSVVQATSDHGWRFPDDASRLAPFIAQVRSLGVRVSLFMDPLAEQMRAAREVGADRVELYTESYARAHGGPNHVAVLRRFVDAAQAARASGLGVNAGHDLNLDNLADFLRAVNDVAEVSIGHALIADALERGYAETIRAYRREIDRSWLRPS
jgi:pyridoxine 5-phosphate synthase